MATQAEVTRMVNGLIRDHGLAEAGWKVAFNRAYRTLAYCDYTKKTLSFSTHWTEVSTLEDIKLTALHEIAHALVGPGKGHSTAWVRKCLEIGGDGKRCADTKGKPQPTAAWTGTCPNGHTSSAHRAPLRVKACSQCCGGRFNPEFIFEWRKEGVRAAMPERYRSELRSLAKRYPTVQRLRLL